MYAEIFLILFLIGEFIRTLFVHVKVYGLDNHYNMHLTGKLMK
jgi:hypothetical protein